MRQNVCLITGGAGFLGQKYCELFLRKNYVVLCVDNNKKNLETLKYISSKNFFIYECDITNEKKVKNLFNKINKSFSVNVLINNAAIDAIPFKKKNDNQKFPTDKNWDIEMNVSLKGSFLMIKYFGEQIASKKRRKIINIRSDI